MQQCTSLQMALDARCQCLESQILGFGVLGLNPNPNPPVCRRL